MTTRLVQAVALLAVLAPAGGSANGGSWDEAPRSTTETRGAIAGADAGVLDPSGLVSDEDVACESEDLVIALRGDHVAVRVDYVFRNHGATKVLDYGFPFAIGEEDPPPGGKPPRRLGEPLSYELRVDGAAVPARSRAGGVVPAGIPVPRLPDEATPSRKRHRWSYRVSRVEFPAGRQRKVSVRYTVPYLVHTTAGERGHAESPGAASYILSTGGGWRGGTIGVLRVSVTSDATPLSSLQLRGLPLARERKRWFLETKDFRPSVASNLVVRRTEWETIPTELHGGLPWTSAPISASSPATYVVAVSGGWHGTGAYRLGLAFAAGAQPARVRVETGTRGGETDAFHATFGRATAADVAENGGYRYIAFEAADLPSFVSLTFLDVVPGPGGERRLGLSGVVLQADVSNDEARLPEPQP